jgi:hypothetical protein
MINRYLTFMLAATVVALVWISSLPAHAQRCPSGADAFLNCLPPDHRYGGPGEISRPQLQRAQRAHQIRTPQGTYSASQYNCVYNYVGKRKADPRAMRLHAMARSRGDTSPAGYDALGNTPEFRSLNREAERACRGK